MINKKYSKKDILWITNVKSISVYFVPQNSPSQQNRFSLR